MPLNLVAILLAVDSTRGPILAFRHPPPPSSTVVSSSTTSTTLSSSITTSSSANSSGTQGSQSSSADTSASQGMVSTSSFSSPSSSMKSTPIHTPTTGHPNGSTTTSSSTLPSPISRSVGEGKAGDRRASFTRPGLNIYDLSPDDLASLLTPKPALYDARFQLDVDDLTFLGLPFPWRPDPPTNTPSSRPSSSASTTSSASAISSPPTSSTTTSPSQSSPTSPRRQTRRSRRRSSLDDMTRCSSPTSDVFVHGFLSPTPDQEETQGTSSPRSPRARSGDPSARGGHVRAASAADVDTLRDMNKIRSATEGGGTSTGRGYKMNLGASSRGARKGGHSTLPGSLAPVSPGNPTPPPINTQAQAASMESSGFQPTMFHVVFVLRCAEYARQSSLDTAFSLAVRKISIALRSEQMKSGYVQREVETMLGAIESAHQDGCGAQEVHQRLLAASDLARELALVYETLDSGGVARFPTEGPTSYALQLRSPYPTGPGMTASLPLDMRRNRPNLVPILTTPTQAYILRPYQALLLSSDPESVLRELPADTAQDVESFLLELTPMHSFEDLAHVLGKTLEEVYGQARILLEWRWARVIDAIRVQGVYVPCSPLSAPGPGAHGDGSTQMDGLCAEFAASFPPLRLPELLSSMAQKGHVPFSTHIPDQSRYALFLEALIFLLQHGLVRRLHPYVIAIVPRGGGGGGEEEGAGGPSEADGSGQVTGGAAEQEWVKAVVSGMGREMGRLFSRLYRYFDGSFHVLEIAAREHVDEEVIETLLLKLKDQVITYMC